MEPNRQVKAPKFPEVKMGFEGDEGGNDIVISGWQAKALLLLALAGAFLLGALLY